MEAAAILVVVTVPCTICLLVASLYLDFRVRGILRRRHPVEWQRLGSPSFLNNSVMNTLALRRFIRSGDYRALDDEKLTRAVKANRIAERAYLVLFVVSAVLLYLVVHK
jgi:hypothetical protein